MRDRVLIVDDNRINLMLLSEVLEGHGFEVHQAQDAEQALVILQDLVPRLILLDIRLPGMDGWTLSRKLRSDDRFKQVTVVALTALGARDAEQEALDAGCDGYIAKPIDTRVFLELLLRILQHGRELSPGLPAAAGVSDG